MASLYCREPARCTRADAEVLARESDVVFMVCHDAWRGHDVCSGSATNCTSSISYCNPIGGGVGTGCQAHDYEVLSCELPVTNDGGGSREG